MNGDRPATQSHGSLEEQVHRLREELAATRAEIARLREMQRLMEADQQAALRDSVLRTRQWIQEIERKHHEALRGIEEEAAVEIGRLRERGADEWGVV